MYALCFPGTAMNSFDHTPPRYHVTIGPHKPALRLTTGDRVRVRVPDCDGIGPDGRPLPDDRFFLPAGVAGPPANPVAGPFVIEQAEPGDALAVTLDEVTVDRNFGRTGISAAQIAIPQRLLATEADEDGNVIVPKRVSQWRILRNLGTARLTLEHSRKRSVEIPLHPFVGCVGVAPEHGGVVDTLHAGPWGGNIDIPGAGTGAVLRLPVFMPGAYLFLGDIHAAQGDGEIIGGGVESSGAVTFRVDVEKGRRLAGPQLDTPEEVGVIGASDGLDRAVERACAALILRLAAEFGFDRWEALHVVSQTARIRPGNRFTAICSVPRRYIE